MGHNKKYWKNIEQLSETSSVSKLQEKEFAGGLSDSDFLSNKETLDSNSTSRRDFLKYLGFTTISASLAACEGPVKKSIPYVVQPERIIPGVANHYATAIADGYDFANVLVKTREGRPILVMPNKEAGGCTNARVQASVLSLYDSSRLQKPKHQGNAISWEEVDKEIPSKIESLVKKNKKIVLLTGTLASPSTYSIIKEIASLVSDFEHIEYDAVSDSGALDAFQEVYGVRALPDYDFSKAKVIVSVGADFIGDWQGGGFEGSYAKGRDISRGKMSKHIQIESNMSLSGANADERITLKPLEQIYALVNLYNTVTGKSLPSKKTPKDKEIKKIAHELKNAGKHGVLLTGIQDKNAQLLALSLNAYLQSSVMGTTAVRYVRQGDDQKIENLIKDMQQGKVGALITAQTNPVYTLASLSFKEALKNVPLTVGFSKYEDETVSQMQYALPSNHYLESWGDVMMKAGDYSLMQPTIKPLFDTRQFQDCLLAWKGEKTSYYEYIKNYWNTEILNGVSWNKVLHDGFYNKSIQKNNTSNDIDIYQAAAALKKSAHTGDFELTLYSSTALGDGQQSNNPWLQELPDPITRASWDNYLTMSPADAARLGYKNPVQDNGAIDGDYAKITLKSGAVLENIPVLIQPGQAQGTLGLAVGYGKTKALKKEMQTGVNAYKLAENNILNQIVTVSKQAGTHKFACEQLHHTIAGRHDIVKEVSLQDYKNPNIDPKHTWNAVPVVSLKHEETEATKVDLWDDQDRSIGHHFNLSIDLNSCTGCGACVIACHAENNVPVVGKDEVRLGRDMHWLRIDRYYASEVYDQKDAKEKGLSGGEMFKALEKVSENPQVNFQPIMCQHCNHAPCETVCPVGATSHGRQGQNHMAYNRCIGTRYCANNCPYRVRRFNWFKYNENKEFDFHMNDDYGRMVLNPDVVVRSRGVMEKCSFCIQSTQRVILNAKKEGRKVLPGEFNDACACAAACSTGAMVFGDVNEPEDEVVTLKKDKRAYRLLEFLGTDNNVIYQVKVRNTEKV